MQSNFVLLLKSIEVANVGVVNAMNMVDLLVEMNNVIKP